MKKASSSRLRPSVALQPGTLSRMDLSSDELEDLLLWQVIDQGGDNHEGKIKNLGKCECGLEYTVNTVQTPVNAWPVAGMGDACLKNPPQVLPPEIPCDGKCRHVQQGNPWHGWEVVKNKKTGQMIFNCSSYAQFHCELPIET